MSDELSVFVGFDTPAAEAYDVCKHSVEKYATKPVRVFPLVQQELRQQGLYTRPVDQKASNEFSMTRFLTPFLSETKYAIFMDCDMILTGDIHEILRGVDAKKAIHVVKHDYIPKSSTKMGRDGGHQVQHAYPRKNWSSFVLWNCEHHSVRQVTPEMVNSREPAYLHRFHFLRDEEIGDFDCWVTAKDDSDEVPVPSINFLVGEYPKPSQLPLVIHYTLGIPAIHEGYGNCDYFKEWMDVRAEMKLSKRLEALQGQQPFQVTRRSA